MKNICLSGIVFWIWNLFLWSIICYALGQKSSGGTATPWGIVLSLTRVVQFTSNFLAKIIGI